MLLFCMLAEHITTIEKSMKQITDLSKQDAPNMNCMSSVKMRQNNL
jgi:hypothetical protein